MRETTWNIVYILYYQFWWNKDVHKLHLQDPAGLGNRDGIWRRSLGAKLSAAWWGESLRKRASVVFRRQKPDRFCYMTTRFELRFCAYSSWLRLMFVDDQLSKNEYDDDSHNPGCRTSCTLVGHNTSLIFCSITIPQCLYALSLRLATFTSIHNLFPWFSCFHVNWQSLPPLSIRESQFLPSLIGQLKTRYFQLAYSSTLRPHLPMSPDAY